MKPSEREEQLLVLGTLTTAFELIVSDEVQQLAHVGSQSLGRFHRHLDTALQDTDGEERRWGRADPHTEVIVGFALDHFFLDKLFEVSQPPDHEMAIGQE